MKAAGGNAPKDDAKRHRYETGVEDAAQRPMQGKALQAAPLLLSQVKQGNRSQGEGQSQSRSPNRISRNGADREHQVKGRTRKPGREQADQQGTMLPTEPSWERLGAGPGQKKHTGQYRGRPGPNEPVSSPEGEQGRPKGTGQGPGGGVGNEAPGMVPNRGRAGGAIAPLDPARSARQRPAHRRAMEAGE